MPVSQAREGDVVLFISKDRKRYLVRLTQDGALHTKHGVIPHGDIIGQPLGRKVLTHLGVPFLVLEPSTEDLVLELKRATQIMFPKDIGYTLVKLGVQSGSRVVEAGTGSGGLTLALARVVGPQGRVYSYESNPQALALARKNLESLGLLDRVELKERDIAAGFDETDVDALFLDVRHPWEYLAQARAALKQGGFFGAIVPTTNQVSQLLEGLAEFAFAYVQVEELFVREYKTVPGRLRPMDRMVAHTGYLIFARKVESPFGQIVGHGAGKIVWPPEPETPDSEEE
ncbi:MAG: tRNA (adenine-N1)-methyltransferase [Anaerolineales bacterium]